MLLSPRDNTIAYTVASAYQMRPLNSRRMQRLRAAWFAIGALVGIGAGVGIGNWYSHRPLIDITHDALPMLAPAAGGDVAAAAPISPALPPVEALPAVPAAAPQTPAPTAPESKPAAAPEGSPAVAAVQEPAKPKLPELPASYTYTLRRHESLLGWLREKSVSEDDLAALQEALKPHINAKRVSTGQTITLKLDANPQDKNSTAIKSIALDPTPLKTLTLTRNASNEFTAKETKIQIYKGLSHAGGTIRSSLYQTAIDSGIPVKMVGEIIQAFSYDIDFQRDIQRGDKIDVVFENTHTEKNVTTSIGRMMYASLTLSGETHIIYRHVSADGFSGFYNAKGESVKKALLRTPINGAHVTSGFGMRMHPLLGYSKMHKGVDFGAPMGTPIYAAGDGIVEEADRKGGYGNFVRIRHNKNYATAYGHASRFAKGVRPGARVRQGQVIAYVGSTGQSTGPHLHYEVIMGSSPVNPSGVKFRTGQTLSGKEYVAFRKQVKQIENALAVAPRKIQVASLR